MTGTRRGNRGATRSSRAPQTNSNTLVRFDPGIYVPTPQVPSWTRAVTVEIPKGPTVAEVTLDLDALISKSLRDVGFSAILVKRMVAYTVPQSDVAPLITMIPAILGSKPQFRVAATSVTGSASVGVIIPADFQGPYALLDNRNVVTIAANCGVYFRLHVVLVA